MNYLIYNKKIKTITHIINFSYTDKTNELFEKVMTGKRYVLNGEDYNEVLSNIEHSILNSNYGDAKFSVEDIDCSDVLEYDGIEANSKEEAETVIKSLTLEEQLLEAQFELDSLKLGLTE